MHRFGKIQTKYFVYLLFFLIKQIKRLFVTTRHGLLILILCIYSEKNLKSTVSINFYRFLLSH